MSIESNEINDILKEMIRDAMVRYKINQRQLAKRINKNPSMVSRWLKNEAKPHIGTVNDIAIKLNYKLTKVNDLWTLSRSQDSELKPRVAGCSHLVLEVLKDVMRQAPEADRLVLGPYFLEITQKLHERIQAVEGER